MALDRHSIERKDFPIGRRGYDPDAVDAHLSALAAEVEDLKRTSRRRNEAAAASEQVRSIVEAAEASAAEIQRQAEAEAVDIRSEATTEVRATREQATAQARDYVSNVSESTTALLERLEAMQAELGALFEALRTGTSRLTAELERIETNLDEVRDAVAPRSRFEPEAHSAPAAPVHEPPPADGDGDGDGEHAELESESAKNQGDALAGLQDVHAAPAARSDDSEAARLVALNMALDQKTREETEQYLAENFRVSDLHGLLDDVYAAVQG